MPDAILEISTYSGEGADPNKPIRFYDPYGNLVYSYTVGEFSELAELPPLPEIKGLIGQGWNWSLEKILEVSVEHQYSKPGSYVIRLIPGDGAQFTFLGDSYSTRILHRDETYSYANKVYGNTIKKIELGKGITEFTGRCFFSNSLETVTMPEGITVFSTAFQGCYSIKTITFPRCDMTLSSYAVRECRSLKKILFSDAKLSLGGTSFADCNSLEEVIIPQNVQLSYTDIFAECTSLKRVVLSDNITKISSDLFDSCYLLKDVVTKGTIAEISSGGFKNCRSLEEIEFYDCYSLHEIVIPKNVSEIQASAFANCLGIEHYYLMPTIPPALANVSAFVGILERCKIHVPKGCLEAYQTAENWSTYADYMVEMEE